ncbi:MAG: hypothetical protein H6926_05075 [Chromatiales bacterium]|nr:hypothetical protein [Chromatiales bacterium]
MRNMLRPIVFTALAGASTLAAAGPLVTAGGTAATPTQYEITLNAVEFKRADGTYYPFFSGTATFDVGSASAGANSTVGAIAAGNSLEPGVSYTAMRVTVASSHNVTGGVANAGTGQPCQTGGAGSGTGVVLNNVNFETGSATGGSGTSQSLDVPTDATGTTVASALSTAGIERTGNQLRFEVPLAVTVPTDNTVPPALAIGFDVAGQLEFLTTGVGTCAVMVLPPIITFTTPAGTTTFQANL